MAKALKYILTILLLSTYFCFFAQEKENKVLLGAGIETYYSVNGHGGFFSPHLSINKNKHHIKLGPAIHKRSLKLSGVKMQYSYILAGMDAEEQLNAGFRESSNGSWRVSIFAYAQFVDYTALSYRRTVEETLLSNDTTINWNNVYLSTAEGGLGAEIDVKIFNYVQLRCFAGVCVYSHLNYPVGMYQDKTAASFIAGAGINFPTFRKAAK